jgi:hypothetical protein
VISNENLTDDQVREYARTAPLAAALDLGDEITLGETILDETGHSLDDDALARVLELVNGATIVILFPDDLVGTQDAHPGPWGLARPRLTDFSRPSNPWFDVGYPHAEGGTHALLRDYDGVPAFANVADARLIVALRNAYTAMTTVPTTLEEINP